MENCIHSVNIDGMARVTATAVEEVAGFTEKEIRLKVRGGDTLVLSGDNLKILCFDNKSGAFTAQGAIAGLKYRAKAESVVKRIFK